MHFLESWLFELESPWSIVGSTQLVISFIWMFPFPTNLTYYGNDVFFTFPNICEWIFSSLSIALILCKSIYCYNVQPTKYKGSGVHLVNIIFISSPLSNLLWYHERNHKVVCTYLGLETNCEYITQACLVLYIRNIILTYELVQINFLITMLN
jgi:hypothetical protein